MESVSRGQADAVQFVRFRDTRPNCMAARFVRVPPTPDEQRIFVGRNGNLRELFLRRRVRRPHLRDRNRVGAQAGFRQFHRAKIYADSRRNLFAARIALNNFRAAAADVNHAQRGFIAPQRIAAHGEIRQSRFFFARNNFHCNAGSFFP